MSVEDRSAISEMLSLRHDVEEDRRAYWAAIDALRASVAHIRDSQAAAQVDMATTLTRIETHQETTGAMVTQMTADMAILKQTHYQNIGAAVSRDRLMPALYALIGGVASQWAMWMRRGHP